jgi:type IX secretion system PorP/SprF family membrane protein
MKQVLFLIFITFSVGIKAQQIPQYSQWFWHQFALNPAHAGIKQCEDVKTLFRTQWLGLEGAPNQGFLTFAAPLKSKQKEMYSARHGIGGKFERDQLGGFTGNKISLSYAAHFNFTQDNRLSVGISAGMQQWIFDKSKITTLTPDPAIPESGSGILPEAVVGAWWNGKNYYVGMALSQLPHSKWVNIGYDSKFKMHTMLNGGIRYPINDNFTLLPGAIVRIPPSRKMSMDLNLLVDFRNQFAFGLGFRNTDAIIAFFNVKFMEQFSVGYSFDYTLSSLTRNQFFSHEISLSFVGCKRASSSTSSCPLFE